MYEEVVNMDDNDFIVLMFLFKVVGVVEELKDYEKVIEFYEKIRDIYLVFVG